MADYNTLARPYAKAAFEYALAESKLSEWSSMLQLVAQAIGNKEVANVIKSPALTSNDKAELILDICAKQLDAPGSNFIKLLSEKSRLPLIPVIAEIYEAFKAEQEKAVDVVVTSAYELNEAQQQELSKALSKRLDRDINLEVKIDKRLIGGVIIRTGDLVIDGSLRGRLAKLADSLKS